MITLKLTKEQASLVSVALTVLYDEMCKGKNAAGKKMRDNVTELHRQLNESWTNS